MAALIIAGVIILAVAIIAIIVVVSRQAERRASEFVEFAQTHNFMYFPEGDGPRDPPGCMNLWGMEQGSLVNNLALIHKFAGMSPFGVGGAQRVRHLVRGSDDIGDWYFFQYSYVVSSGKSSTTYTYSIFAVELDCHFPGLTIRRAGFLDRAANALGMRDIQFESAEFNDAFHVVSEDERFAYDLLHAEAMTHLEVCTLSSIQLKRRIVMSHYAVDLTPNNILHYRREITEFVNHIPRYVVRDRSVPPISY